ncbi:MAG: 2-C-methyl-D-erythritol 2,4-cyclodiphosphate synthase [Planctomycetes bacterium]|nr:2-C-methyl-D-erythritol 2,4-cyclodiphosphate synthase [Planctomycetota bacterium]
MLVGIGYDVHRLVKGRRLVLGGVEIDSPLGLEGHSDADVVIHAVCDAVLGAAALGDIGEHFPDSDPKWKNVSSKVLLEHVVGLAGGKGLKANNLDVVIIAQAPKLGAKKLEMRDVMARLLGISPDRVNVKATTTEGLGDIGEGKGIAAQAVVSLSEV